MIYHLSGILSDIFNETIVVDVNGVGYSVIIPSSYIKSLPEIGASIKLFTYHHIREDNQILFGFLSIQEKSFFIKLISVSGVGPKIGVKILSEISIHHFSQAILENNLATLTSLPGVGKKMAERMILDLKDKLDFVPNTSPSPGVQGLSPDYIEDLTLALKTLGYSKDEIKKGISNSGQNLSSSLPLQSSIKQVLKHI